MLNSLASLARNPICFFDQRLARKSPFFVIISSLFLKSSSYCLGLSCFMNDVVSDLRLYDHGFLRGLSYIYRNFENVFNFRSGGFFLISRKA